MDLVKGVKKAKKIGYVGPNGQSTFNDKRKVDKG